LLCDLVHVLLRWQAGSDIEELADALHGQKAHRPPEEEAAGELCDISCRGW
jgi:hypothetical protein